MSDFVHVPVLIQEIIQNLNIRSNGIYVDCTVGLAGHSSEILKKLDKTGKLIGFDKDTKALDIAWSKLKVIGDNFTLFDCDYSNIDAKLSEINISEVDGILVDLGASSMQFDDSNRGFSYSQDAKLDMRMDQRQDLSAYHFINEMDQEELANLIFKNTGNSFSRSVARSIVENRPIKTTFQLNDVLRKAIPASLVRHKHPGKTFFQAFRIAVNNELESLENSLEKFVKLLKPGGVLAIITFHSIEDRIVKSFFNKLTFTPKNDMPVMNEVKFYKKQISPSKIELENNKRSRSAKLRILRRLI